VLYMGTVLYEEGLYEHCYTYASDGSKARRCYIRGLGYMRKGYMNTVIHTRPTDRRRAGVIYGD
jgi:hypothetical protein